MTYAEIKQKQKRIAELNLRIEGLRSDAEAINSKLSHAPVSCGEKDRVGNIVAQIVSYEEAADMLRQEIKEALDRIPRTIEGECIRLRVRRRYTWTRLAHIIGGGNNAASIKMRCYRFKW